MTANYRLTWDDDALTVCVTHLRFVPCRVDDGCRTSQHPDAVAAVRTYQQGDLP